MITRPLGLAAGALLLLVAGIVVLYALRSQVPPASVPATAAAFPTASATTRPEQTKPPGIDTAQPQLPLPTLVRWAVDRGSPDDPQHRSLLVFFFTGNASGFRLLDAAGNVVLRVPIAGSGIFGPETCVARARMPNEITTWVSIDQATLDLFMQRYRTYKVIADGIPTGEATLDVSDSGCRP